MVLLSNGRNIMEQALNNLLESMKSSFSKQFANRGDHSDEFVKNWCEGVGYEKGRKYYKIIYGLNDQPTVWGFIVAEDGEKFKAGDILMAKSWSGPATNFARGNIFGDFKGNYVGAS
tara:strand:- start:399 stop:749 length:351 start_codon:yes stop_codon:yes gene_type:complete